MSAPTHPDSLSSARPRLRLRWVLTDTGLRMSWVTDLDVDEARPTRLRAHEVDLKPAA